MGIMQSTFSLIPSNAFVPTMGRFANRLMFQVASEKRDDSGALRAASAAFKAMASVLKYDLSQIPNLLSHVVEMTTSQSPSTDSLMSSPWMRCFSHVTENQEALADPFNAWLERFVKVEIGNAPIQRGTLFEVMTPSGKQSYQIHQTFAKSGLVAYALKPVDPKGSLKPLIVFRPTEIDPTKQEGLNSVQNDLDKHIGLRGWNACKDAFGALMKDPSFLLPNQKVQVAGYSLGGAQAQYFVAEHFSKVAHAIFYNAPSISPSVVEEFAQKADQPLLLQIYRTMGDPCHLVGGKQLGWGVSSPDVKVQLLDIEYSDATHFDVGFHRRCIFDASRLDYQVHETTSREKLMRCLDNQNRSSISRLLEIGRQFFSFTLNRC